MLFVDGTADRSGRWVGEWEPLIDCRSCLLTHTRRDLVVVVLLPEQCKTWQPQLKPRLVIQATAAPVEARSELTESLDRKPIRPVDRSWPDVKRCVLATMAIHTPTVGLVRVWYAAMTIASLDARHASNPDFIWTCRSQHRSERSAGEGLRVIKGSSSFTDKTWKGNVSNIYGGDSYLKSSAYVTHPSEMPTICTNVFDARPDGEVHTYFICPQAQNPPDYDWCCGMLGREECCQNHRQSSSEQKRSNEVSTKEALMVFFAVFGGHILMALLIYCCVKNGRHRNCSCNCCRKSPPLTQSVRSRVTSSTALNPSAVSRRRALNSLALRIYTALLTSDRPIDREDSESSVSDRLEMTLLGDCEVHPLPTTRELEVAQVQLPPATADNALRCPPPSYCTLQAQTAVMHASTEEPAISTTYLLQQQDVQGECDSPPHYSTLPSAAFDDRLSFEADSQSFMEDSQSESENSLHTMSRSFRSRDQDARTGHPKTRALVADFSHLAQQEFHDGGQTQQTSDSHNILGDPPPAYDGNSSV